MICLNSVQTENLGRDEKIEMRQRGKETKRWGCERRYRLHNNHNATAMNEVDRIDQKGLEKEE